MRNKKYKILVLSDLKSSTKSTLKSTVSLAKILKADVDFFYVKKPTEVVKQENQLAAKREINRQHVATSKKINSLLDGVSKDYDINISSSFAFGNIKAEIENHINSSKPDIIVLGKRKSHPLKISGDNITSFILKIFNGSVLISSDKKALSPDSPISLGLLNDSPKSLNTDFEGALLENTKGPLKAFKIQKNSKDKEEVVSDNDRKLIEYVFEKNDNSIRNLSTYIAKSDINLAYLKRGKSESGFNDSSINQLVKKIEIPILLTNDSVKAV